MAGETKRKRTHGSANHRSHKKLKTNPNKKQKYWIQSCSQSINRIPSDCVAKILCKISRVELNEKPLLPLIELKKDDETNGVKTANDASVEQQGDVVSTDNAKDTSEIEGQQISQSTDDVPCQIAKLKTLPGASDAQFSITDTILVDGQEKKIFIPVQRDASAVGPTQWQQQLQSKPKSQQYHHLPNGDNGDGITNPYPKNIVEDKYWAQRHRLFSKYDQGIKIDSNEMWYSITPEAIANHIADRIIAMNTTANDEKIVILDAFCGCGGNAIAFAKNAVVIAVDNDLRRLHMSANNARVYNVDPNNVVFIHADVVDVLRWYTGGVRSNTTKDNALIKQTLVSGYKIGGLELLPKKIDAIFLSPPWGGMGYETNGMFDPVSSIVIRSQYDHCYLTTNGGELFNLSLKAVDSTYGTIAYFLPRNVNGVRIGQIAVASGIEHKCFELEQNVVNGKVKTVTAYFSPFVGKIE